MTNKLKTVSRYIATILLCSCLVLVTFVDSATAITRSCNAQWVLRNPATNGEVTLETFTAKGTCGKNVPNRCRIRANEAAHNCMQVHFETRWDGTKPEACQGERISNYDLVDLKAAIEKKACNSGWGVNKDTDIVLIRKTTGDKRCPKTVEVSKYTINPAMCKS